MEKIRRISPKDIPAIKAVLDSIDLFPSEMLEEMIQPYFDSPTTQEIWFTRLEGGVPISLAYCAPEKMTEGTYNLYAIGVHKNHQGKGVGKEMMGYLEEQLKNQKQRILIVETSSVVEMANTRAFYKKCAYTLEATIRDFWCEGEDKVVFWKKL